MIHLIEPLFYPYFGFLTILLKHSNAPIITLLFPNRKFSIYDSQSTRPGISYE